MGNTRSIKQSIMCHSSQVEEVKSLFYYWTTPSKGHSGLRKRVKPISCALLLIPAIIVGNAGAQSVINIWRPFPWRTVWLAALRLHRTCHRWFRSRFITLGEFTRTAFGLSMEKWPGGAEKHNFVGVAAAFRKNTDNSFCFTSGNTLC